MIEFDERLLMWINSHHNPVLDYIMGPVSTVGEYGAMWILICLGMMVVNKPGYRKLAFTVLLTMLVVDRVIGPQVAHMWNRPRPYMELEGIRQVGTMWTSSSFPSGHAHSVWVAAILLGNHFKKLIVPFVLFAIATCYSRPYFGMHYPLDMAVGSVMGIVAAFTVLGVQKVFSRKKEKRR